MWEALETKILSKWEQNFGIYYDWSCKNEESVFYLSTNSMFGIELLKKYDWEEDMRFSTNTRTFIEIALKTLQTLDMASQIKSSYFPIIYQKTGYWIDI